MKTSKAVQDVNLHWSDLTKLIGSVDKLLYEEGEEERKEEMQSKQTTVSGSLDTFTGRRS